MYVCIEYVLNKENCFSTLKKLLKKIEKCMKCHLGLISYRYHANAKAPPQFRVKKL